MFISNLFNRRRNYIKSKRIIAVAAAVSVFIGLFAGCSKKTTVKPTPTTVTDTRKKTSVKVGFSTDTAGKGDKAFNDAAITGLDKIKKEYTVDPEILESKNENAYAGNLAALAEKCTLTFGVGISMQQSVTEAAKADSNRKFAIIDYVIDLPNVVSITFKTNESSFLAGVIAGRATKTNKVGFMGEEDIPLTETYEAGFIAGVMSVNSLAADELINRKNTVYTGKIADQNVVKEAAKALYNSGCDVIYHSSGSGGTGLFDTAMEFRKAGRDVWAIGSDLDQAKTVSKDAGAILTSSVKKADIAVYQVTKSLIEGELKTGTVITFGLREEGVGIASTKNSKAPAGIYDLADIYKRAIIEGKIVVPDTLEQAKSFKPVNLG